MAARRRRDPPPHFFALLGAQTGVWAWTYNASTGESDVYSDLTDILGDNLGRLDEFMELVHPDDIAGLQASLQEAVATRSGGGFECRVRKIDGDWIHFQASICVETSAEGHILVHGVSRDVTAEVKARSAVQTHAGSRTSPRPSPGSASGARNARAARSNGRRACSISMAWIQPRGRRRGRASANLCIRRIAPRG